ncbi:MAG TPA: pyruvate kinase [Vicinamibacteria bacterium]|nr:pyruvate kinase [Vicinamibacteria bacterium]
MSSLASNELDRLAASVDELRAGAVELENSLKSEIARVTSEHRASARNLIHYLALRQEDIRGLQPHLAELGLSSLGRLEGHVLATLEAVLRALNGLAGKCYERASDTDPGVNPSKAAALLADHSHCLLGARPVKRSVRIMVTMPSEAAKDYGLVRDLVSAGMNVMRINCAHDGPEEWKAMISHLRHAERQLGLRCRVQADLAGPKLRTGPIAPLAKVLKLRPERDGLGRVVRPARAWLTPSTDPEPVPAELPTSIHVAGELLAAAQVGDVVAVTDARGRPRALRVVEARARSRMVEFTRTVYLTEGATLGLQRDGAHLPEAGRVEGLADLVEPIVLREGDSLALTRADDPGHPGHRDEARGTLEPARIHCTLPEAFDSVKVGDRVFLDDGKIGGTVSANDGQQILLRISQTPGPRGAKLRPEKGINFPDTELNLPCLTSFDVAALEAIARDVDILALSFVRRPEDLDALRGHLERLDVHGVGIVLKIESRAAFENMPRLLLAALRSRPVGVMVARGDLGVEMGFERLSEVQEEILWLCEAAHVPVIWATQVLERMAKTGSPTRAEVSDAAMSGGADCVMLNKGPHIVAVVEFLGGILERVGEHQSKKTAMLRKLSISENLPAGADIASPLDAKPA